MLRGFPNAAATSRAFGRRLAPRAERPFGPGRFSAGAAFGKKRTAPHGAVTRWDGREAAAGSGDRIPKASALVLVRCVLELVASGLDVFAESGHGVAGAQRAEREDRGHCEHQETGHRFLLPGWG